MSSKWRARLALFELASWGPGKFDAGRLELDGCSERR
jgi:hypothetical protein